MNTPIAILAPSAPVRPAPRSIARYASAGARILMGLTFLFAGLNGLVPFVPPPPPDAMPAGAAALTVAFASSGYLLPLVGATQALVGALLLSNRFVPLALTLIAPVIVNIMAFHVFLAPQGLPIALVVLAIEVHLAIVHRRAFRSVLVLRG